MAIFMDKNFLLNSEVAVDLYDHYAKDMAIIDYHCHLSPKEIYENKPFENLTQIWLYGDHYKWRAMRANGIEERFITGDASDFEKFSAWVKTAEMTIGNPLYSWSHLELRRFFGIEDIINGNNAASIWDKANAALNGKGFTPRELITKSNVEVICTTDDPADALEYHLKLQTDSSFAVKVLPTFRPDKALGINKSTFAPWVAKLGKAVGRTTVDFNDFLTALEARMRFFHEAGCRISDHALDDVPYAQTDQAAAEAIFTKVMLGEVIDFQEEQQYKTFMLHFLCTIYAKLDWTMQLHMNAARDNNTRMIHELGPDTGFDSINDSSLALPLGKLLDGLEKDHALPRTILYSLNTKDYPIIASLMGSFQSSGIPGKIQFGSAWWFNDTKDGMLEQLKILANFGLLGRFIGMLTDSRSFLSYIRHEYFRRILCNLIADWVNNGEAPDDREMLGRMIQGICYENALHYFNL